MFAFAIMFFRQVHERQRIQSFLQDLQEAHKKVEELTLANERQRMARDLHDTLAQGVAGLIMRLEAADAHLSRGNTERTGEIIKQSMQQARRTLADAREQSIIYGSNQRRKLISRSRLKMKSCILQTPRVFL